jgi:hypothetical protein
MSVGEIKALLTKMLRTIFESFRVMAVLAVECF